MPFGTEKTTIVWLPDGEKKFIDMFSRFDTIPACHRRRTDFLQHDSPRYAYHRAVKSDNKENSPETAKTVVT